MSARREKVAGRLDTFGNESNVAGHAVQGKPLNQDAPSIIEMRKTSHQGNPRRNLYSAKQVSQIYRP